MASQERFSTWATGNIRAPTASRAETHAGQQQGEREEEPHRLEEVGGTVLDEEVVAAEPDVQRVVPDARVADDAEHGDHQQDGLQAALREGDQPERRDA